MNNISYHKFTKNLLSKTRFQDSKENIKEKNVIYKVLHLISIQYKQSKIFIDVTENIMATYYFISNN